MDDVDMLADQIADLARQARDAQSPTGRVAPLAEAVGLAVDPLMRLELLMLLADAAGRAAHEAAGCALAGDGMPEERRASWSQIGASAGLTKDTAWRQWRGGEALSWSPAARGVRQAKTLAEGSEA